LDFYSIIFSAFWEEKLLIIKRKKAKITDFETAERKTLILKIYYLNKNIQNFNIKESNLIFFHK
jgi:hypothetical protein